MISETVIPVANLAGSLAGELPFGGDGISNSRVANRLMLIMDQYKLLYEPISPIFFIILRSFIVSAFGTSLLP